MNLEGTNYSSLSQEVLRKSPLIFPPNDTTVPRSWQFKAYKIKRQQNVQVKTTDSESEGLDPGAPTCLPDGMGRLSLGLGLHICQ